MLIAQLEAFLAVAERRGVSRAAKALYLTQPALSARLRNLEFKPGEGAGTVSAMTSIMTPVPPGVDNNAYWRELDKQLGVTLEMTMTPDLDYLSKL